jgi:hypothetical protein
MSCFTSKALFYHKEAQKAQNGFWVFFELFVAFCG